MQWEGEGAAGDWGDSVDIVGILGECVFRDRGGGGPIAQNTFRLAPVSDVSVSKCSVGGGVRGTQPPTTRHPWRGLRLSPASVPANCCLLGRTLRNTNILHKSQDGMYFAQSASQRVGDGTGQKSWGRAGGGRRGTECWY